MGSIRDSFGSAQPFFVGVGVPVILGMLAFAVPALYSQGASIARLDVKLDTARSDLDKLTSDTRANADRLSAKVDLVNARLRETETDPNKLIAKVLGVAVQSASFAYVNGKVVIFPRTESAATQFISSGFRLETVAPNISGFVRATPAEPKPGGGAAIAK